MKKGNGSELFSKTKVEFDESICLTDDQLEATAGGVESSVGWSLCGVSKNGEQKWTASVKKNAFFGLIPFNKKKTFATEKEALNWIKNQDLC